MNIFVCAKQVPDTNEIKIDPETNTLIRKGVPSILNTYDAFALEQALRIKDNDPENVKITVISMGPPQAESMLRDTLAVGADKAYLVTDRKFGGSDTLATSYIISEAIKEVAKREGDYDMIFCGLQAIDGDTAQVGPEIAEHLNIPQVTYVQDVKVEGDSLIVNRALEDGHQIVKVKTPCLLTAIETLNEPRYMNVSNIFATNDNDIKVMSADDIDVDKSELGLKGSPTKVKKSMTKEVKGAGELVKEGPKEAAAYVLGKLKEKHYI